MRDCHARDVYHGDIKTENIMVTSWNWLYLTDFSSSFKKTYLPEDNPADFSYFFDTSGRRTCYLAPERFSVPGDQQLSQGVTWAMDIFSVGCVIAELFLEAPIFSLSQLFKYRKNEYDPELTYLSKIDDVEVRDMVTHMISLNPEKRYSADEYLKFWRKKAFPEYFYSFLHQYMGLVTDPSSGRAPVLPETANFGEADDRIDRIYYDFDKIAYFLGYEGDGIEVDRMKSTVGVPLDDFSVEIDIPNNRHTATSRSRQNTDDGTLLFLTIVLSSLRNTARSTARVRACDLMLAFGERITDESKLDRVLPYVVALLTDRADIVKIAALRTMTQLLSMVSVVLPVNAYVFTEYVRPRLQNMIQGPGLKIKPPVRAVYATCLASLAHTSSKILDMVQALKADGSIANIDPEAEDGIAPDSAYQNLFDVARYDLVDLFESHTKALLTDSDASVRTAFLGSISSLCVFFGSSKTNDVILSHLNTYLNDKDWILKCAFFQTIVGVAIFTGGSTLGDFILPLMLQALTDPEEFVVEKVISSFASMAELGLFQKSKAWEMVDIVGRFMMHPNFWIKEAAAHFVSSATRYLSIADAYCIVLPLIQPYLKTKISDFTEHSILDALKRPLSRPVFDMAMTWATKADKSLFWKPGNQRTFSFAGAEQALPTISSKDLETNTLRKLQKNDEDEQWLTRLRNIGMGMDDEFKLLALREYIGRVALKRPMDAIGVPPSPLNNILNLKEMEVTPQTIFFENQRKQGRPRRHTSHNNVRSASGQKPRHTIADALLDASTTIDDPTLHRKNTSAVSRRDRINGISPLLPLPPGIAETERGASRSPSATPHSAEGSSDSRKRNDSRRPSEFLSRTNTHDNARSDGTLTPTGSLRTPSGLDNMAGMRHKSSAINLLNRRDTSKTIAETSTTSTNAIGTLDGPFTHRPSDASSKVAPEKETPKPGPVAQMRAGHTYDGNDPNIMKLLDSLASENFPSDLVDFGPLITPVTRKQTLKRADSQETELPWRPQGILVATFGEHKSAISRVLPAPDHTFFITAADDGTVKVWDTLKLERNIAHRSRQTHRHAEGVRVTCITFVENTHTFVSCASDGSVNVVKVDYAHVGDTTKYGKLRLVRDYQLEKGEHAIWCEHFKSDARSVLMLATNNSRIIALDLRMMTEIYFLENPLQHGSLTTFCIDKKHNWLLLGTSHGVLDLWDLRFRLRLKAWGLSGGTPIHRLQLHPFKGRGKWVCVAGGTGKNDVTVWDIEKFQCREVYRAGGGSSGNNGNIKENLKIYDAYVVDDEKPESMLNRFATSLEPGSDDAGNQDIRALAIGINTPEDGRDTKYGFFLTGGSDRKVRFWDLTRVETSAVISGLETEESQPKYMATHPTTSLTLNVERQPQSGPSAPNAGAGTGTGTGTSAGVKSNTAVKRSNARPSRSTVISLQQQQLLRNHLDTVMDVALLESPVGMVVSVDRSGVIYVYQ